MSVWYSIIMSLPWIKLTLVRPVAPRFEVLHRLKVDWTWTLGSQLKAGGFELILMEHRRLFGRPGAPLSRFTTSVRRFGRLPLLVSSRFSLSVCTILVYSLLLRLLC
jgi:hypothetical protein